MRAWSRGEEHPHRRRRSASDGTIGWLVVIVLFGEVLGGMVGVVEAPRRAGGVPVSGVERSDERVDDDDHDPLVTWPLLGMVLGGAGGMAAGYAVRRVRGQRWTSARADVNGMRR
jgi:hypothetical protein